MTPNDLEGYATAGLVIIGGLAWITDRIVHILGKHDAVATGQLVDHTKVTTLENDMTEIRRAIDTVADRVTDLRIDYGTFKGSNEASHLHVTQSLEKLTRSVEQMQSQVRMLATGVSSRIIEIKDEQH